MGHWHVIVEEGGRSPRRVTVRQRRDAELEAQLEGRIPDKCRAWVPFRSVQIAACDQPCLDGGLLAH